MDRRQVTRLIAGAAALPLVGPLAARAQERMRRIGVLMAIGESAEGQARLAALRGGLRRLGRVEGRNLQLETRWAAGDNERVQSFARELVNRKPDLIVANTTVAARALQQQTRDIPIVFVLVSDPVGDGLISSLPRPGGNLTGFTSFEFSFAGKWLELLKESTAPVRRVGMLFNPATAPGGGWGYVRQAQAVASSFAFQVAGMPVGNAQEIEPALDAFAREPGGGLMIVPDAFTSAHADKIVARAAALRLPAIYPLRLFAVAGGLMSYGIDSVHPFEQAASYVDRILKGEKPAELPVQAPTKFEFVINLKAAKALGLTVPATLVARADEVIE